MSDPYGYDGSTLSDPDYSDPPMKLYKFLVTSDDPIIIPTPTDLDPKGFAVIEGVIVLVSAVDVAQARLLLRTHWGALYGDQEAGWVEFCEPSEVDTSIPGVVGLARV